MPVYGVNYAQTGNNAQVNTDKPNGTMGKDEFLKLLVAQLQAQDPLKPMESTEFTAQLAQFSSLEQLQNIDTNLGKLQTAQSSLNNTMAVEFVGKSVIATGNSFELEEGYTEDIHFKLYADAKEAYVNIYDQGDNLVKTIDAGAMQSGDHRLSWNGVDSRGNRLADGIYSFEVMAVDYEDRMVGNASFVSGTVTGVSYRSGSPILMTGGREIPFDQIIEVQETVAAEGNVDGADNLETVLNQSNQVMQFMKELR